MPTLPSSDLEPLCENVPFGRLGLRFLSIDIAFCHRDVEEWDAVEAALPDQHPAAESFQLKEGVFLELSVQTRASWPLPWRRAYRLLPARAYQFWPGFGHNGGDTGWLGDLTPRLGVDTADLTRLAQISSQYNNNARLNPASGRIKALFIPRAIEAEIRGIAARLRRSRGCW